MYKKRDRRQGRHSRAFTSFFPFVLTFMPASIYTCIKHDGSILYYIGIFMYACTDKLEKRFWNTFSPNDMYNSCVYNVTTEAEGQLIIVLWFLFFVLFSFTSLSCPSAPFKPFSWTLIHVNSLRLARDISRGKQVNQSKSKQARFFSLALSIGIALLYRSSVRSPRWETSFNPFTYYFATLLYTHTRRMMIHTHTQIHTVRITSIPQHVRNDGRKSL